MQLVALHDLAHSADPESRQLYQMVSQTPATPKEALALVGSDHAEMLDEGMIVLKIGRLLGLDVPMLLAQAEQVVASAQRSSEIQLLRNLLQRVALGSGLAADLAREVLTELSKKR
jgi:hypothetical protein